MDASEAMAVCELSLLDDWVLLELLDRVPLGSLLRIGRVNWRFKGLVERNLLGRRHFGIVIGRGSHGCSPEFKFNGVTVAELDRLTVERILELLPGITSLTIVNNRNSSDILHELLNLLEGWVDQLESLNVWLMEKIEPPFTALPLFGLINRMRQLKKLRFVYYNGSLPDTDWTALHLPVIGQLQKFAINTYNEAEPVLRQLHTHATNQLTEVDPWCPFHDLESSYLLLDVMPHLAIRFTSLQLFPKNTSFLDLATIFQRYTSLRELGICLHLLSVGQVNRAMAMLPQLTKVVLWVDFPRRRAARQSEDAVIILGEEVEPDTVDGSQLVPLPRVTDLKLGLILSTHTDFEMLHLGALFPKLIQLQFYRLACLTCGYHFDDGDMEARRRCLLQLQSKATFDKMFPELCQVTYLDETLAEEDWQPKPPMPRPLLNPVISFFGVIICKIGRHLTAATTGQVVMEIATKGLLAVAKKAFQLVRHSMSSILGNVWLILRK